VKTIFLEGGAADDPLSKLMHQITGAVAEFERAKITERYRRGKTARKLNLHVYQISSTSFFSWRLSGPILGV